MRSMSSVVIPGLMAACALSRTVRAMWHALREPSICFAVLIGTAQPMQASLQGINTPVLELCNKCPNESCRTHEHSWLPTHALLFAFHLAVGDACLCIVRTWNAWWHLQQRAACHGTFRMSAPSLAKR